MSKHSSVSRRTVLGGMAVAVVAPVLGVNAMASTKQRTRLASTMGPTGLTFGKLRFSAAITALADGRLLVSGGYHELQPVEVSMPSSSAQMYDPSTREWTDVAPLQTARAQHAAALMPNGQVVVLGGFSHMALDSVEIYDPVNDRWTYGPALAGAIYGHTAAQTGQLIAISGGQNGTPIQLYDPKLTLQTGY